MSSSVSLDGGGVVRQTSSSHREDGYYHRRGVVQKRNGKREQERRARHSNRRVQMTTTRSSLKRDEDAAVATETTRTREGEERGEERKGSRRRKKSVRGRRERLLGVLRGVESLEQRVGEDSNLYRFDRGVSLFSGGGRVRRSGRVRAEKLREREVKRSVRRRSLRLLHPEKVQYVGENEWENVYLRQMVDDGVLKLIDRQNDVRGRSADDLAILDEAFEHSINERHNTVVVVSNDKYEGHCPSSAKRR